MIQTLKCIYFKKANWRKSSIEDILGAGREEKEVIYSPEPE